MSSQQHTIEVSRGGQVVALARRPIRLEVVKGVDKKLRCQSEADRVVIGTHPGCNLPLSDPRVSRQHCEIRFVEGGYRITDLNSTNGTYVGDIRVHRVEVEGDVKLRVGDTLVKLSSASESVEIPVAQGTAFGPLLGRSTAIRRVFSTLEKVAPTESTVLITGESGTGKEVCARAIHEASARKNKPFIVVDCGALPGNLIESELFGHERGAFTGAIAQRKGAFETAHTGTVFLDEIGEMPLELQSRLLGVLERRQVSRVGATEARNVDVRLLAATNRDLRREVNRGTFREDLYYRLAVVEVELPPLRKRRDDVPVYIDMFLHEMAQAGRPAKLDPKTMDKLLKHSWPGNVRELRNAMERALALGTVELCAQGKAAEVPHVPFKVGKAQVIETFERSYIERLMSSHENNITQAARSAEIDRVYLLRLLDKYGMRPTK